jgi:hypothetical protein
MATSEIKAKYPFRMRSYDDDGNFIKESRTIDPSTDNYDVAVNIGDRNEYRYGGTHFRWYKGSKLVAVYLTEFGSVYGPESIAKGDCPLSTYVGGKPWKK